MRQKKSVHLAARPARSRRLIRLLLPLVLLSANLSASHAQVGLTGMSAESSTLADLSLEQLANVVVTSVSRRAERLTSAPASIYVISNEDIRRSGVTTLPEALRLAPNLQIARADAQQYAISARGFNNVLANKLLVMIDGRAVYSPLFSGTYWEVQSVVLDDVERIEVVTGPGATLWGANAVNGVINVITRRASDTQGVLVSAGAGSEEREATARFGAQGLGGHYRVYLHKQARDSTQLSNGNRVNDSGRHKQAGFRYDRQQDVTAFTLQGDIYEEDIDQTGGRHLAGANLLARWETTEGRDHTMVQVYYDRTYREQPNPFIDRLQTVDFLLQQDMPLGAQHLLQWGAGYRHARDETSNGPALGFKPADRTLNWSHAFVQDEIEVARTVKFTLGTKVERNSYSGAEWLPNARLTWQPDPQRLVWGALSRAVRAPSRVDREFYQPAEPPYFIAGGPSFDSEVAVVSEVGYRAQASSTLSYSLTVFHHDFDRVRSVEPRVNGLQLENKLEGKVDGAEAWLQWRVAPNWRLSAGGVSQHVRLKRKADSADTIGLATAGNDAEYWWSLRSSWDVTPTVALDVAWRRVDELPQPVVPRYDAVDLRLGWQASRTLEVALTGNNVFDRSHPEWGPAFNRAEFDRSFFLRFIWRPL